jgi:hypothetical protein
MMMRVAMSSEQDERMSTEAIGGYFQLELPPAGTEYHRDALRFQSSRAAFLALLRAGRPSAVWMPWYICESMCEPLVMAGIPIRRYELDERLRVKSAELAGGEWLLYVNYFGLCDSNVSDVLDRFPRERVVIDNAQAFFAQPHDCLATLYSPRKFVGVPDGGYLVTNKAICAPEQVDHASLDRCAHLLKRIADDAESGYADYAAAEESLRLQEPKCMSALTQRILAGIDYADVRARRVENFAFLHEKLQRYNRFSFDPSPDAAPLCYPYRGAPAGLRDELRAQRIYTASYWAEVAATESAPDFERGLPGSTVFLPCDQRLSRAQREMMVRHVLDRLT